jgi:hypothetical protein
LVLKADGSGNKILQKEIQVTATETETGAKTLEEYRKLSPAGQLAWDYCILMGETYLHSTPAVQEMWTQKFEDLLAKHKFSLVKGSIHFAWNEINFWQSKVFRRRGDPVDYFIDKYDHIEILYREWERKHVLARPPATSPLALLQKEPEINTVLTFTPEDDLDLESDAILAEEREKKEAQSLKDDAALLHLKTLRARMTAERDRLHQLVETPITEEVRS